MKPSRLLGSLGALAAPSDEMHCGRSSFYPHTSRPLLLDSESWGELSLLLSKFHALNLLASSPPRPLCPGTT